MTQHLSLQRMGQIVAAGATPDEELHLRECPQCHAEAEHLRSALTSFREGLMTHAETYRAPSQLPVARSVRPLWPAWMAVATAAMVLIAAPVYRSVREHGRAQQALADARLLDQVDREISEGVPSAMQPLEQLVSWDSSSQKGDVR